jgi:outer membrane protein OmpA-like peptidoglycan-associated protein
LLFISLSAKPTEVKGGADHPMIKRFAGSQIVGYKQVPYDEVDLPAGKSDGLTFASTHESKGKVTRIAYTMPAGKTAAEVMANYVEALGKAGFITFYSCKPGNAADGCGGQAFTALFTEPLLKADPDHRNQMIQSLYASDNVRYLGAELKRGDSQVDLGLMVSGPDDKPAGALLVVIDHGAMTTGQVTVDANAMSKGLASEGKIALYGLTFDTDSAKLTSSSDPTLKQMSDLLHKQPSLKVYIVGHTDDTGALAHNLTLSQQRAESVVKALTTTYGIAANRLSAKGLASYAPVASNHDDAGKAKNRRVELVEQ